MGRPWGRSACSTEPVFVRTHPRSLTGRSPSYNQLDPTELTSQRTGRLRKPLVPCAVRKQAQRRRACSGRTLEGRRGSAPDPAPKVTMPSGDLRGLRAGQASQEAT